MATATKDVAKKDTSTSGETERPNKVKITDAGPCLKKVSIEIPAATVAEQLGTSIDTLLSEAALPGFRKGHAPKRLVEKKFGSTIRREAKNQLVATAFSKAIEDHKLRVVGDATSEMIEKVEIVDGKPLAFEVDVEVVPEFELPALDGIDIKKPLIEVTDDMVKAELDRLLLNEGKLESKEKPGAGDYLTGHAIMKDADGVGGKTILDINDAVVQIPTADKDGKGMILGVVVDDFGAQIGHPHAGHKFTVKTTGPDQHEDERIRGKKLVITFDVKRADSIIAATLEDVASRYGMENGEQVKDAMKQRIEQRIQVDQQAAMRSQVAKYLLEKVELELPQRLTATQAARNLERTRMELMYRGADAQKIEEKIGDLRAASAASAARELKLFFVLDRVAEKLDVKVSEAELNARIAQMAIQRGERPEKLRQQIIANNQGSTVYGQVREHKTMDAILAKSKVSELPLEQYNKVVGEENEHAREASKSKSGGHAKKAEASDAKHDKGEDKPKPKSKK